MACASFAIEGIQSESRRKEPGSDDERGPFIKYYRASELIPSPKPLLHNLLKKEPAVWASVQISSGILSVGLGIVFAVTCKINQLLLTLLRVPIITGLLFLISGFLSTHLYKHPELLKICLRSNIGCLVTAVIGVVLLSVDISRESNLIYQIEVLALCITLLDIFISAVLIFFIWSEMRNQEKK